MRQLLDAAAAELQRAEVPRPLWTAEQLLSDKLGIRTVDLYLSSVPVAPEMKVSCEQAVAQRAGRIPLQYLLRKAAFYGRDFEVGPGVFIPRPETEVLIETVLTLIAQKLRNSETQRLVVVDVGTGSGAIAVTLGLEVEGLKLTGIDQSREALGFAARNASRYHVPVTFFQGNLGQALRRDSCDLIAANLPYLDPDERLKWPKELSWEPWISLDGGAKGVAFIRRLMEEADLCLRQGGHLVLEIGAGQGPDIVGCLNLLKLVKIVPDLAGMERVVVLRKV